MLTDQIQSVLRDIQDPEMPISIIDLGIIDGVEESNGAVTIRLLPTFVGCPALDMLTRDIAEKTGALAGVSGVNVQIIHDPPWTPERISDAGREQLRRFGVTVPQRGGTEKCASEPSIGGLGSAGGAAFVPLGMTTKVACPFCGADRTRLENVFGPTRCRMIYYCDACRNPFEHMKPL